MRFLIFIALFLYISHAASAPLPPLVEGEFWDYMDPRLRVQQVLRSVENLHLYKAIKQIKEGKPDHWAWADLDFTLRWFPNHPMGLKTMSDFLLKYPAAAPPDKTAEYYFKTAINYKPSDPYVHTLYGIHLHKEGKLQQALEEYKIAEQLAPDSADLQYNMGLLYIKLKEYKNAVKHAEVAYKLGHPLPGLRNKLKKAGYWKNQDNKQ